MANQPSIFDEDVSAVLNRLQTSLEQGLGRALAPADVEMLILNFFAYETQLLRITANQAFRQNLIDFATASMLDFLAALLGVTRLPAAGATCTLQFNLVDGHSVVQLPAGIRVQSVDGLVYFTTVSAVNIQDSDTSVSVDAICQTTGSAGNGYDIGKISVILDPQAFVSSVSNNAITSGGVDAETDDQLRARVKLAPASFSVAGPTEAYEFFAKSAHPSIVDVKCVTTNPGEVTLYPLCTGGTLSSDAIKDAILAICSSEKVRPQNDTVLVADPTIVEYSIDVSIVQFTGAITADLQTQIETALNAFVQTNQNKLGVDIIRAQINAKCVVDGQTYNVTVNQPVADIVADESTYTKCTGISVTITGSNDG